MEKLRLVDCEDPILNSRCEPLTLEMINDHKMQQFFDSMLAFARGEQSDQQKHVLVGLAAPQIGIALRVILVDIQANGKGGVAQLCLYINPEIIEFSEGTEVWYEACFSTGHVKGIVQRPRQITVRALDREGREICETHEGYVARIFQHEIDHLEGIRFPNCKGAQEPLHLVKTEEMHQYRNEQGWRHWKAIIPKKDWQKHMKDIL